MKKLPNHLAFHLTKEDFETTEYIDNKDCALARAIKRSGLYLSDRMEDGLLIGFGVGGETVGIEGSTFAILEWDTIQDAYDNPPAEGLMVNLLKID